MSDNWFIVRSFGLFFRHRPVRLMILFFITLFLGFNQGFTIVLLIPLLGLLNPVQVSSTNKWIDLLKSILNYFGLELNLTLILAVFALCLVSVAVLNYLKSIIQASYEQEFSYQTRKRLFKKIIASDWKYLNGKSKHNHLQILTTEIPKLTNYYYFYLGLITKVIFIAAHVALALMISVKFTLFVVFIGLLLFILLRSYLQRARLLGDANIQIFRKMLKHIDDFWLSVKVAKVHNSEEFYFNKFDETNIMMLEHQFKQLKTRAIPQLLFTLAGIFSLIVIVYFAYQVAHLQTSLLFILILLFARIFPQFMAINSDVNMVASNVGSVKMVLTLDREIEDRDFEKKKDEENIELNHFLEIRNMYFGYNPRNPLFNNFSVSIPAKQITGIIGKSGCGKTTLIDLIAGLQMATDGSIAVDGITLTSELLTSWRSELGYLPQDSFFIEGTIRENLVWDSGRRLSDKQIIDALKSVNADHFVLAQKNGLETAIVNYQYHFSGGERQRLALARVLLRKPGLLLLDEATSALDSENETQIMECLERLKKEVTILFITHRQNLGRYFDKVINLDDN